MKTIRAYAVIAKDEGYIYQEELAESNVKAFAVFAEIRTAEAFCDKDISEIVEVEITRVAPAKAPKKRKR